MRPTVLPARPHLHLFVVVLLAQQRVDGARYLDNDVSSCVSSLERQRPSRRSVVDWLPRRAASSTGASTAAWHGTLGVHSCDDDTFVGSSGNCWLIN